MIKAAVSANRALYLAILATLLMVLYAQFVLGHFSNCFTIDGTVNSLGLSFGYSTADVLAFFGARTKEQLLCYTHFLVLWDTIFPVLYTAMYVSWMVYLFEKWFYLSFVPIIHMAADWLENYFEISLVNEYLEIGRISDELVAAGSFLTITKWSLSLLTYIIILCGIISSLRTYLSRAKQIS